MAGWWHSVKQWFGVQASVAQQAAEWRYVELVAAARQPHWYAECGVPDTLDGRFEMVLVHLMLLQQRLERDAPAAHSSLWEMQRALGEHFFRDMDRSLREMGVADTGVGRRMKAMGEAYFGRLHAYKAAWNDSAALQEALRKNVYGALTPTPDQLNALEAGLRAYHATVQAMPEEALLALMAEKSAA